MIDTLSPPMLDADAALDEALARVLSRVEEILTPVDKLRVHNETRVLRDLSDALKRARTLSVSGRTHIAQGARADANEAVLDVIETLREGIANRDILDEIDRELTDAAAEDVPLDRKLDWGEIDGGVETLIGMAGDLVEHLKFFSHAHEPQGAAIMDEVDNATAEAVRDVGITLAAMIGGGAPSGPSRGGRRYEAVADQMAATLDTLGLPHDGVQLAGGDADALARARLIDGLTRNFSSRERDGSRIYYRAATPLASREAASPTDLLRGSALINANMMRAEADAVLGIIDRLPSMARFQLAQPFLGGAFGAKSDIHDEMNAIVVTVSDPIGLNRPRAAFQFFRLVLAIFDYLDQAEVMPRADRRGFADLTGVSQIIDWLARFRDEQLCVDSSVVRDEEIRSEIANLIELVAAIGRRLIADRPDEGRGQAAARLEECLTAARVSVDALELSLERSGTDLFEQDIQYDESDDVSTRLSIGQFIRWVRATSEPFARAENRAATLREAQVALLGGELRTLAKVAGLFSGSLATFGLRRSAPRMQFDELETYLETAADEAERLIRRVAVVKKA